MIVFARVVSVLGVDGLGSSHEAAGCQGDCLHAGGGGWGKFGCCLFVITFSREAEVIRPLGLVREFKSPSESVPEDSASFSNLPNFSIRHLNL